MSPPRPGLQPMPIIRTPTPVAKRPRQWLVSVPVWGLSFLGLFHRFTLPAIREAANGVSDQVRVIAHTDDASLLGPGAEVRPLPPGKQWFNRMSAAHREVIGMAAGGDVVVLLTADMVVSGNAFAACRAIFETGKRLVCINSTRVNSDAGAPPSASRELSEWGWANRHGITRNCTWPNGRIDDLSRVYFQNGRNAVCRMWLPHPLAFHADGRSQPFGPTIDCNLVCNYRPEEVHVVTNPDELAVVELSPRSKVSGSRDADEPPARTGLSPLSERYHGLRLNPEVYRTVLSRRIVVAGDGNGCGDDEAVGRLLA